MKDNKTGKEGMLATLLLVFVFIAGGIILAAYLQFSAFRANWEKEIERHLTAVSTFKAFQVEQWYKENLGHSRYFTANATLARIAGEYLAAPSHNTRDELLSQFTAIKQNLGYDAVRLFDAAGASLLAAGARHDQVCSPVQKGVARALHTKEPVTSDIYRNEHTGSLEFSIFAPLIAAGPAANVTGVLVLSFDPGPLFALINSWPEPSASAESLLVRVEADRVIFLGELRHRQGTALTLEIPLSEKNVLAVQAAEGRTGYVTGIDYRGVPVVGVVQPVANGDWYLVNKIDRTEAYAPVHQRAWTTVFATAAMLVILAVSLGAFRYERQSSYYRREYQAELERAALRKHYEYLTKYANDIIFLIDMVTLRIAEANERAEAAYGYTRDELLAMKATELRPPEHRDGMAEFVRSHQAEDSAIYETVHRRKDGTTFPIEVSGRIIHFEGKSYAQAIIRDITERRQAEQALRDAYGSLEKTVAERTAELRRAYEERDRLFTVSLDLMYIADLRLSFRRINPAFERTLGYTAEEILAASFTDLIHPGDREKANILLAALANGGPLINQELRVRDNGGNYKWLSWSATPVLDTGLVYGTARDVTERRRIEQHLAESLAFSEAIIANSPLGILVYNPNGDCLLANEAAARITGGTTDQLLGQNIYHIGSWQPSGLLSAAEEALRDGRTKQKKVHIRTTFAKEMWLECYLAPFLRDGGLHLLLIIDDVTTSKQLEETLRLTNAQLLTANSELEAFSYSVSHDLRAPLRSIDGFSQILLEDYINKLDKEGIDCLHRVRAASQRMGVLIDDLLNLSRVSRSQMNISDIDLTSLAAEVVDDLRVANPDRRVEVGIQDGVVTRADSHLLRVVLNNLIGNAWKFTAHTAEARIEIGMNAGETGPVFFVKDNGAGFDMEYAAKLFVPFQRLHSQREFPGTGIGLATVQRIINRHGGRIWAESMPGQGTVFYFTLS